MQSYLVGALFLLSGAGSFWSGALQLGMGLYRPVAWALIGVGAVSMVFVSMIEDTLPLWSRDVDDLEVATRAGR